MRNVLLLLKILAISLIGLIMQLVLHEYGHVVLALLTGNVISNVKFGIASYATINIVNGWSVPIISLGSFILPIGVCMLLGLFKNRTINMLVTVILAITMVQLFINAIAILVVKDSAVLQTYDLGLFITNLGVSGILVSIISFAILVMLGIWLANKLKKVVESF